MSGKSSVSALQEFCAKNKLTGLEYKYIDSDDGSFICKVDVMDYTAYGNGRSKRDAKHLAAANIIKKLRVSHPEIDDIPQAHHEEETPTTDMISALRDYCVQRNHPLPIIEIVQQSGTPDAPEFVAVCTIASICRYGVSEKKKDARQKAAMEMMRAIAENDKIEENMEVAALDDKWQDVEEERYKKFKTYRELTESKSSDLPGIKICDRHNYFQKFYDHIKADAHKILNGTYNSSQEQMVELLNALKIKTKVTYPPTVKSMERLVMIELNCEYDVVFIERESKIYMNVVNYFKDML